MCGYHGRCDGHRFRNGEEVRRRGLPRHSRGFERPGPGGGKKHGAEDGGKVFAHIRDVTDKAGVYELGGQAVSEMGKGDILKQQRGVRHVGVFPARPDEVWGKTIAVNPTSFLYTIRASLPCM